MATLGEYLKFSREKIGYSLSQVYEKTGITDSRLSRMEHDATQCPPEELKKLADLYQVSLVELFIMAGYLTNEDLSGYQRVFNGVSELDEEEKDHIQQCINLLIKRKEHI